MSKVLFYLLDVGHAFAEGSMEIRLWGVDSEGKTVLVRDRSFSPWFYLICRSKSEAEKALNFINSSKTRFQKIRSTELVTKKLFGREVTALKIACQDHESAAEYSESLQKLPQVSGIAENDVRPTEQYLLQRGLLPCTWIEAETEFAKEERLVAGGSFRLTGDIRPSGDRARPALKIMSFAVLYSASGRNRLILVSARTSEGVSVQFEAEEDEGSIISGFVDFVHENDPDVVVGYQSNSVDWPLLMRRARDLRLRLDVDRAGGEPHPSIHGHISIAGRANVDLFEIARDQAEPKVKTLENVVEHLGIARHALRVEDCEIDQAWKDPEKRKRLRDYAAQKAELILKLSEAFLDYAIQMSSLTGLPLDQVPAATAGFKVDAYLIREAYKLGELIPQRVERPYYPYRGGLVLAPKPGLHENIAVLDFTSMYPNLMLLYNVSPDTLLQAGDCEADAYEIPGLGYRFRKSPEGMYTIVLNNLLTARSAIKAKIDSLRRDSAEKRVLEAQEQAVKTIANAVYGYAGWIGARWYVREVAESTAALGRNAIETTLNEARNLQLELTYGDTDSIFVENDAKKVEKLEATTRERLKMEIKMDKVYARVLFTEAKKRYAGLLEDGSVELVGLEAVRGDWSEIAKNVQEKVVDIVLREKSPKKAVEYVRNIVDSIHRKDVEYSQFVIWKTLAKPLEAYEVRAPHVEAARELIHDGWRLTLGDKIGYVITSTPGKLYQKAKPYIKATVKDIDAEYYVANQVIPAAFRILEILGVSEDQLPKPTAQRRDRSVVEFMEHKP